MIWNLFQILPAGRQVRDLGFRAFPLHPAPCTLHPSYFFKILSSV